MAATTPSSRPSPSDSASPRASSSAGVSRVASRLTAPAPAACSRSTGGCAAQQCTTVRSAAASTVRRCSAASCGWGARRVATPLLVRIRAASTAGSEGSSSCSTTVAPGTRRATSSTCRARPSPRLAARSRTAPWSARTRSPRLSSSSAARVHGPAAWTFTWPGGAAAAASSRASRSRDRASRARIPSMLLRGVMRHPLGCRSTVSSASRAAVRPARSDGAPRPGSSGRNGRSGSSSSTSRATASGSVPGMLPRPVALAVGQG